jgi:hypothetical protein
MNKICMDKPHFFMLPVRTESTLLNSLIIKVIRGNIKFIELLNHVDKIATQTALFYAARKGHTAMCR